MERIRHVWQPSRSRWVASNKAVELLSNVTLFADVTDRVVAGIETNLGFVNALLSGAEMAFARSASMGNRKAELLLRRESALKERCL
jgi:hypothetical protein